MGESEMHMDELKSQKIWLCWNYETRKEKRTKVYYQSLSGPKKTFGTNYSIRTIDLEKCLYQDFGNGFNVKISGCIRTNRKCPVTLYLVRRPCTGFPYRENGAAVEAVIYLLRA